MMAVHTGMINICGSGPAMQVMRYPDDGECLIEHYDIRSAVHIETGSFAGFHIKRMKPDLTGRGVFGRPFFVVLLHHPAAYFHVLGRILLVPGIMWLYVDH